jgi:hypothetical protein
LNSFLLRRSTFASVSPDPRSLAWSGYRGLEELPPQRNGPLCSALSCDRGTLDLLNLTMMRVRTVSGQGSQSAFWTIWSRAQAPYSRYNSFRGSRAMIGPLKLQIAIIVLVGMTGIIAVWQAQGQAMSATARAAGTTSFGSRDKGAWLGSRGFSSTNKSTWMPSSGAFIQGGAQPGGLWHTRPGFVAPSDGETATNRTAANMGGHQVDIPLQGRAGSKPAFGVSRQRPSFTGTRFGGIRSTRGRQSGSAIAGRHGSTGLAERHGSTGLAGRHGSTGLAERPGTLNRSFGPPPLRSGLGRTTSGLDLHADKPQLHPVQSTPQ